MVQPCYITALETTHKHLDGKVIGTCGPCSFINLIGIEGNFKLEKKLAEEGRLKPFHASDFTSFLVWAQRYNKSLLIYVENTSLSQGSLDMMCKYEGISLEKQSQFKSDSLKRRDEIIFKNKSQIRILKKNPLVVLDNELERGNRVAFGMADYFGGSFLIGHMRVCMKKTGDEYIIYDSREGELLLSRKELKKGFDNNKKLGSYHELIVYNPNSL